MKFYTLEEICVESSLTRESLTTFVEKEWIAPLDEASQKFDEEDLGRIRLIIELKNDFNVNEEGVDLILHLLDQFHSLKRLIGPKSDKASSLP